MGVPAVTNVPTGPAAGIDCFRSLPEKASDAATTAPATVRIPITVPYVLPGDAVVVVVVFPPGLSCKSFAATAPLLGSTERIEAPTKELSSFGGGESCARSGEIVKAVARIQT